MTEKPKVKYNEEIAPVLSSYRITLPKEWREKHNVEVGSKVKLLVSDQTSTMILVPVDVRVLIRERQPSEITSHDIKVEEKE